MWVSHSQLSWTSPFVFLFQMCSVSPLPVLWVLGPASQAFGEEQMKLGVRKNLEGLWQRENTANGRPSLSQHVGVADPTI